MATAERRCRGRRGERTLTPRKPGMGTEGDSEAAPAERRRLASPRALLAAEEILARWMAESREAPLDRLVQSQMRGRRYLNSSERRWAGDAVFGAVRFWRQQTWLLERAGGVADARTRIELWARMEAPDADAGVWDHLPGTDTPAAYLRETLSYPDDMAVELEQALGSEAPTAAEALNRQAPTTLRVNVLRASRERVMAALPNAAHTRFSPWGLEIPARANVPELSGFQEGWFEIQEEASQLVALLTDARPGQTVVDIGAGAGGKSLAIAAMLENKGTLTAVDTSEERLARLEKRARRAGATVVKLFTIAADEEGRWQLSPGRQRSVKMLRERANCVLVDAPCTGSGVLRRSPDVKWREVDHAAFARLQRMLLEQSAELVRPDGVMIYATCSFERAQNEDVINAFLDSDAGREFEITPAVPRLSRTIARLQAGGAIEHGGPPAAEFESLAAGPFMRTWPHRHGLDAFFAACLMRRSAPGATLAQ